MYDIEKERLIEKVLDVILETVFYKKIEILMEKRFYRLYNDNHCFSRSFITHDYIVVEPDKDNEINFNSVIDDILNDYHIGFPENDRRSYQILIDEVRKLSKKTRELPNVSETIWYKLTEKDVEVIIIGIKKFANWRNIKL